MSKLQGDSTESLGAERRRTARRGVRWPAMLMGSGVLRGATCVDVSSGGVALELDPDGRGPVPSVGSDLVVAFHPRPGERVMVPVQVVRSLARGVGLRVLQMNPEALRWLHGDTPPLS